MNKRNYGNIVFLTLGTCTLLLMGTIVAVNFSKDARFLEKPVVKIVEDSSAKPVPKPQDTSKKAEDGATVVPLEPVKNAGTSQAEDTTKADKIKVEVVNYSGIKNLAEEIRSRLEGLGFEVSAGNGSSNSRVSTQIIERNDKKAGVKVQKAIGAGKVVKGFDAASRFDVTVIMGDDYKP